MIKSYDISFYKDVYDIVENFKKQNKDNYSPSVLRNLAYQQVIDKYGRKYPSLITRRNKYVGEWLTVYKRKVGIINTDIKKYATENKYISYGILFSTLKLLNPFTNNQNFVLTLPGNENEFRFEKLLLRKFDNITSIDCVEHKSSVLKQILNTEKPYKIKVHPDTISLEKFLREGSESWYSFVWADFCSVSTNSDFEDIVNWAIKPNGIFAITETQRQTQDKKKYRFHPNPKNFEFLMDYTYQPSNMILKVYKIKK
jgi:hypothetical protein